MKMIFLYIWSCQRWTLCSSTTSWHRVMGKIESRLEARRLCDVHVNFPHVCCQACCMPLLACSTSLPFPVRLREHA